MQLGWAPIDCSFTTEEGVGDSKDSFAYDGKRMKKWSVHPQAYGQTWVPGDVIGSCIDLDLGQISFYRNGVSMGVAFTNVRFGENAVGIAYFPAVSLSYGERCTLNFVQNHSLFQLKDFKVYKNVFHHIKFHKLIF
eukprot:TRINITY_DN8711_c0_g1_i1.p1 TRINITY_DN8711_c0_g1~~TRINITY_DN8711_c0_g1_i1.p1  ORF type:complete len:136 (-),score=23.89 TRINITY_DN8711_c0_g1_i1:46-453(-)